MARNRVANRKKGGHTASNLLKGLKLQRRGESIRNAAKICGIAHPTLRRYVAQNLDVPEEDLANKRLLPNYENHLIFNKDQEDAVTEYIKDWALKFYRLTAKDCRKVAYQMGKVNDINMPDSWKPDNMAGKEYGSHRDLSIKKPEACSLARATSFNRVTVKSFFENLKIVMGRHPSFGNGCRLYNLDETATTTVQRPQKVVGPKGRYNIAKVTSGEKGILVTTCAIVSASGQALPPAFVFPRKNFKDIILTGAPPGSLGLAHPSGWMTSDLFIEVMKHFIKHTAASPENPALLILDNHESHLSIEALDMAKKSGVTILTLHPHTKKKRLDNKAKASKIKRSVLQDKKQNIDVSEDDEDIPIIRGNFPKLTRRPAENDFVLVIFKTKNIDVYYVAKIIEVEVGDNYGVSFMRLLSKENMKFRMPLEPDIANVKLRKIKIILPPPKINGTGTQNSTLNI